MAQTTTTGDQRSGEAPDSEYAHLRRKRAEREGNVEPAVVEDVFVGTDAVTLTFAFDWGGEDVRVRYDLDDDREVLELEAVAGAADFEFEQVGHMEGSRIELVYTGDRWVPEPQAEMAPDRGSAAETFRTELRLLARTLAGFPRWIRQGITGVRDLSTKQLIIGFVLAKKVVIVAAVLYLIL